MRLIPLELDYFESAAPPFGRLPGADGAARWPTAVSERDLLGAKVEVRGTRFAESTKVRDKK